MSKVILDVPDVSCAHCEKTILGVLTGQAGVREVRVDIPAKTVALDVDEAVLPLSQVQAILDDEGYPVAAVHPATA
jgi:copper chaperone